MQRYAMSSNLTLVSDIGPKGARPGGGHEGVSVGVDPEVVPVDPGQPRREVAGVPVDRARGPQLTSEALLDVGHGLEVAEEDLTQQRDVGDGQPQGVDLAQPLLVGKSRNVASRMKSNKQKRSYGLCEMKLVEPSLPEFFVG